MHTGGIDVIKLFVFLLLIFYYRVRASLKNLEAHSVQGM